MPFDNNEVAIRARNLITEASEGPVDVTIPHITALIPTSLETWARLCFQSREKRELFKRRFLTSVSRGRLDLTPFLDGTEGRINLKELRETIIYEIEITQESEGEIEWQLVRTIESRIEAEEGSNAFVIPDGQLNNDGIGRRLVITHGTDEVVDSLITAVTDKEHCETEDDASMDITSGSASIFEQVPESESESEEDATPTETGPFTWVASHQQLEYGRPIGSDSPACFLEGSILRTRSRKGDLATDLNISFTVTNFPDSVGAIPFTLRHDFIQFLALQARPEVTKKNARR